MFSQELAPCALSPLSSPRGQSRLPLTPSVGAAPNHTPAPLPVSMLYGAFSLSLSLFLPRALPLSVRRSPSLSLSLSLSPPPRATLVRACWPARERALLSISRSPSPAPPPFYCSRQLSRNARAHSLTLVVRCYAALFLYPALPHRLMHRSRCARRSIFRRLIYWSRSAPGVLSTPLPCVARSPGVCSPSLFSRVLRPCVLYRGCSPGWC